MNRYVFYQPKNFARETIIVQGEPEDIFERHPIATKTLTTTLGGLAAFGIPTSHGQVSFFRGIPAAIGGYISELIPNETASDIVRTGVGAGAGYLWGNYLSAPPEYEITLVDKKRSSKRSKKK